MPITYLPPGYAIGYTPINGQALIEPIAEDTEGVRVPAIIDSLAHAGFGNAADKMENAMAKTSYRRHGCPI